jgi:hypothetical protein
MAFGIDEVVRAVRRNTNMINNAFTMQNTLISRQNDLIAEQNKILARAANALVAMSNPPVADDAGRLEKAPKGLVNE